MTGSGCAGACSGGPAGPLENTGLLADGGGATTMGRGGGGVPAGTNNRSPVGSIRGS